MTNGSGGLRVPFHVAVWIIEALVLVGGWVYMRGKIDANNEALDKKLSDHIQEEKGLRGDYVGSKVYEAELRAINKRLDDLIVAVRQAAR